MVVIYQSLIETGQAADADVAQSVVRRIGSAEVTGPIPVISSIKGSPERSGLPFFISGRGRQQLSAFSALSRKCEGDAIGTEKWYDAVQ